MVVVVAAAVVKDSIQVSILVSIVVVSEPYFMHTAKKSREKNRKEKRINQQCKKQIMFKTQQVNTKRIFEN